MTISPFWGAVIGAVAGYALAERGDLRHVGDPTPLVGAIAGAAAGGWLLPSAVAMIPPMTTVAPTTTTTVATVTPSAPTGNVVTG